MDKEFDALNELNFDSYRDPVELFDRIWEKANEKAQKEYPDDPDKMHDKLHRHIQEMLVLVEQPVSEITNNISNITNNPAPAGSIWDIIFDVVIALFMVVGVIVLCFFITNVIWH